MKKREFKQNRVILAALMSLVAPVATYVYIKYLDILLNTVVKPMRLSLD